MSVLPDHVQKIVAEIETEIGEVLGDAESAIEGGPLRGHAGNGRVKSAVREILAEVGKTDRAGLVGTPARSTGCTPSSPPATTSTRPGS